MEWLAGRIFYDNPPPFHQYAYLVEANGFTSLLIRQHSTPSATASFLYLRGKQHGLPIVVYGYRGYYQAPTQPAVYFTTFQ